MYSQRGKNKGLQIYYIYIYIYMVASLDFSTRDQEGWGDLCSFLSVFPLFYCFKFFKIYFFVLFACLYFNSNQFKINKATVYGCIVIERLLGMCMQVNGGGGSFFVM